MYLNKKLITGFLLAAALGVVFAGTTHRWAWFSRSVAAAQSGEKREKKVLFWYGAMEPSHHYNSPGKAPDGMDLVPMYEGATTLSNGQSKSPGMSSAPSGERKVLYWFDPMHPKYRADKPGIAPDCGMTLVPKYADEAGAA